MKAAINPADKSLVVVIELLLLEPKTLGFFRGELHSRVWQFFYRATARLIQDAVDDCLLDLVGKFGDRPEIFPPGRDRAGEVIHEMLNAALTATKVKQQVGSHYAPTQSRSPAYRSIGISHIEHALLDQVD